MRFVLPLLFVAASVVAQPTEIPVYTIGEDTYTIDTIADGYVVTIEEKSGGYSVIHFRTFDPKHFNANQPDGLKCVYSADSTLRKEINYARGKMHGTVKTYYANGRLYVQEEYTQGKRDGKLMAYYSNGQLKREERFENGESMGGVCFDADGAEIDFTPWETKPRFVGGETARHAYVSSKMHNPYSFRLQRQYEMVLRFVIAKDGTVKDVKVHKSTGYEELDEQGVRIIEEMPAWIPATRDGKPRECGNTQRLTWSPSYLRSGATVRSSRKSCKQK